MKLSQIRRRIVPMMGDEVSEQKNTPADDYDEHGLSGKKILKTPHRADPIPTKKELAEITPLVEANKAVLNYQDAITALITLEAQAKQMNEPPDIVGVSVDGVKSYWLYDSGLGKYRQGTVMPSFEVSQKYLREFIDVISESPELSWRDALYKDNK
ncbi:MAG: hypothetical protein Q8P20_00625 [bacterium]|nr:hypothetical protein [bacterium]